MASCLTPFLRALALVAALLAPGWAAAAPASCPALLDRSLPRLQDESPQNLCQYSGKVVLIVNTASHCGFTGQYKGLEELQARYASRGLVVLGFPSNDFGKQEPGNNKEIAQFCENTFGVKFPMFAKSHVVGSDTDLNPLYAELKKRTGQAPKWNFHKFLVARDGSTVAGFTSEVEPDSARFVQAVEKALAQP